MRKVFVPLILILALLAGCGGGPTPLISPRRPDDLTAAQALHTMLTAAPEGDEAGLITILPPEGGDYLHLYGLDPALCADYAIARLGGARVFELVVVRMVTGTDPEQAEQALENYRATRQGDFTGYAPDQAKLAEEGGIAHDREWLALIISEDMIAVSEAFRACLSGGPAPVDPPPSPASTTASPGPVAAATPFPAGTPSPTSDPRPTAKPTGQPAPEPTASPSPTPEPTSAPTPAPSIPPGRMAFTDPGIDDMSIYDTSAILAAWESGDESGLSGKDRAILDRCREIIGQVITHGMSDLEKEWAIYSWLTANVGYDWTHNDPYATTPRTSYEPYGPIVDGVGICLGYATTFQLFMDLLDIECITVVGAAFQSQEDHAWNMVRLDGAWYCVDATWDNNSGGLIDRCAYFNATSQFMADTDHQWDYGSVPEATVIQYWRQIL